MLDKGQVVNEKREKAASREINTDSHLALVQGQQGIFIRDVSYSVCHFVWLKSNSNVLPDHRGQLHCQKSSFTVVLLLWEKTPIANPRHFYDRQTVPYVL